MKDEYCGYDTEDVHGGQVMDEVMCEVCGTIQPATNKFCSHCGEEFKKRKINGGLTDDERKSRNIGLFVALFVAVVVAMVLTSVFHDLISEDETVKKEEISIEMPEISMPEIEIPDMDISDLYEDESGYPEGYYYVGEDIPEGEYIVISDNFSNDGDIENMPYFAVDDGEVNLYTYFFNSYYVLFETYNYIETEGCTIYPVGSCPVDNTPFENQGMFKVGVDVEAGEYSVVPLNGESDCSYWIYDSAYTMSSEVESGEVSESGVEIELKDGQYLLLFYCRLEEIE